MKFLEITDKGDTTVDVFVLIDAGISAKSGIPTIRRGGKSVVRKGLPFDRISCANTVKEKRVGCHLLNGVW